MKKTYEEKNKVHLNIEDTKMSRHKIIFEKFIFIQFYENLADIYFLR